MPRGRRLPCGRLFVLTSPSCYTIGPPKARTVAIWKAVACRVKLSSLVANGDSLGPAISPVFAGHPNAR